MATATGDDLWKQADQVKTLLLEHHMAARRLGFSSMFEPLYKIDDFKTDLLKGTLPFISFFSNQIRALVCASREQNDFAAATIVRKHSPLLSKDALESAGTDQMAQLGVARDAFESLMILWSEGRSPKLLDILRCVAKSRLFDIGILFILSLWSIATKTVLNLTANRAMQSMKIGLIVWEPFACF